MSASFDRYAQDYDAQLQQGIALSGEGRDYFARKRVEWLRNRLSALAIQVRTALDFGCGTGAAVPLLREVIAATHIIGVDISEDSLAIARAQHRLPDVRFEHRHAAVDAAAFDLGFCNGVFHHIPPPDRHRELQWIFDRLRPGGYFAFWENNPWNPGTRWVMSRIAFDRDAVLVWPRQARQLLRSQGFQIVATDFCFIFPRFLAWLRPIEPLACKVPVGAQYLVLAKKPA